MFITRWRWVAGVALALPRFRGGRKVPPQLARMAAEDLIAAIFPDQLACAENLVGEREIPDHPLVGQTIADCLNDAMDIEGLERLLARLESGAIRVVTRDLTEPSPLALEVLSARPYAYLDDAPLEERRTQAVMGRRWLVAGGGVRARPARCRCDRARARRGLARCRERRRAARCAGLARLPERGGSAGGAELERLARRRWRASGARRGCTRPRRRSGSPPSACRSSGASGPKRGSSLRSPPRPPMPERDWSPEEALVEILRGRLEGQGPVTAKRARSSAWARAGGDRGRADGARGRGLRAARTLHAGCRGGRVVRAPAARPHSPLHGQASARRDRAGRRARLPAIPVSLAARDAGLAHARAGRGRGRHCAARRLRGAGRRLGDRDPAGAHRRVRAELARRSVPGRTDRVGAPQAAQRTRGRQRAPPGAGAQHADHAARAASCPALDVAVPGRGRGPPERPGAGGPRLHSGAGRLVLRRAGRRRRAVARPGRRGARRAGGARAS